MLIFSDGTDLPESFADFGHNFAVSDDADAVLNYPVEQTKKILASEVFEKDFRAFLGKLLPGDIRIVRKEAAGKKIITAPAFGAYYNLAGWMALARAKGITELSIGAYESHLVRSLARVAGETGFHLTVTASVEQADDEALLRELEGYGAAIDTETCREYFDFPYTYREALFGTPPFLAVPASANFGGFPKPALSGIFAGIYGEDLLEALGMIPEACVVPVNTGLNAVAVFKAFGKTDCLLATYEKTVAQEFHVVDTMCYSIKVRRDEDIRDVVICPECAAFWRLGRAARLGCDRVITLDTGEWESAGLKKESAAAAAETFERLGCEELLILEADYGK